MTETRFISRLALRRDSGAIGAITRLLRDDMSPGRAHGLIWTLFADDADRKRDFLFRRGGPRSPDGDFLVVSTRPPRDGFDLWRIETKPYDPRIETGQKLMFKLRANPTVTRAGKRHDMVMDLKRRLGTPRDVSNAELWEQCGDAWLRARAPRLGFDLHFCRADGHDIHKFSRPGAPTATVASLDLSGAIEVTKPERLRAALFDGVGHGKAWGCGLFLLKPI
jgi:CRISPR system Cascade subunit CasE